MNFAFSIALIELILRYGPEAVIKIIRSFNKEEITLEDIKALKVKPPKDYFKGLE
jgi:hypothetical protein